MFRSGKTLVVVASLLLCACAMGPDFKPPQISTPPQYRYSSETEAVAEDLKWWELFDDPVLYLLVTTVLENNKDLLIAASRIEEARAVLGFTQADQYPRFDLDAGGGIGNFAGGNRSQTTNHTIYVAPAVRWEIDFWGKYRRAAEAGQAELTATVYGLRSLQLSLISETAVAYYQLLDFRRRLAISKQTLDSRLKGLDIINQRFNEGIIPEIDVNQAQIQKEIAASAIPLFERFIARTEHALNVLLGRPPGLIEPSDDVSQKLEPPLVPVGIPAQILERRPDIGQAFFTLHAQTARIGVATAMRLPAISLTGALGLASSEINTVTSSGGVWSVGGSALGPIFDFGKNKQRVVIEEERTRQALLTYERSVLNALREVDDALIEMDTLRRELDAVTKKLSAARNANTLSTERYDLGVTSYLEVLEANRTLFSVELEASELHQRYLTSYVLLYKALGGGWISEKEMNAAPTAPGFSPNKDANQ